MAPLTFTVNTGSLVGLAMAPRMMIRNDLARTTTTLRPSRRHAAVLAILAVAACTATPPPESPAAPAVEAAPESEPSAPAAEAMPESVVTALLETSAQGLHSNVTFLLAVRFQITPGYRISWTNPGDVGQSTRVNFEVPEGFELGEVQFPVPSRFELPGGLVSYGYENETAVFAQVTAPKGLSSNQVYRFDVRSTWLACKMECASEELNAWFELPANPRSPSPQLPEQLVAHYEALPKAFAALPRANHDWKRGAGTPALSLTAPPVKWVDFFPGDVDQPKLLGVKPSPSSLDLRFESAGADKPLRGLAVGEVQGKTAFFDVNVPWPSE